LSSESHSTVRAGQTRLGKSLERRADKARCHGALA
jgi:hypothetical protein